MKRVDAHDCMKSDFGFSHAKPEDVHVTSYYKWHKGSQAGWLGVSRARSLSLTITADAECKDKSPWLSNSIRNGASTWQVQ